jgi:hypothetical protein
VTITPVIVGFTVEAQLAVYCEIEQSEVARPALQLKPNPDRQTSFGFSGRFCPVRRPLFQGTFRMIASIEPTAPSPAPADRAGEANLFGTTGRSIPHDVRSTHGRLPSPTLKSLSWGIEGVAARYPLLHLSPPKMFCLVRPGYLVVLLVQHTGSGGSEMAQPRKMGWRSPGGKLCCGA